MPRYRCPRCGLEVEAPGPRLRCAFCNVAGVFARVQPQAAAPESGEPLLVAPKKPITSARPAPVLVPAAPPPRAPMTFVATPEERTPDPAPRRRSLDAWLKGKLLRWMGGRGRGSGDGIPLRRLLPPLSVAAFIVAGTALGVTLVDLVRNGGLGAVRADPDRLAVLGTAAMLGLILGWSEWFRHRGARWGLFARGLGLAAANLGGLCLGALLGDWLLSL